MRELAIRLTGSSPEMLNELERERLVDEIMHESFGLGPLEGPMNDPTVSDGYGTGFAVYVLRQASRRSWMIGQTRPVKVKFLHYDKTMQESCLRLMGKKLLVSLAMEGKFSTEGLQALEEDDDILTAMARELVTQVGVGDDADQVWRLLQAERNRVCGVDYASEQLVTAEVATPPKVEFPPTAGPALAEFATANRPRARRSARYADEDQLSLGF